MKRPADSAGLRATLLAWYDEHRRDLPWRGNGDDSDRPYRVWVSEVMLQQTRVEAAKPYFERWLRRFPDVPALAAAPLDDVLKQWEGLGYYSRARNLHAAARVVAERHGGRVPDDPGEFRALPGVGRYTAGAVMSIAFGRAEPVVDGNVRRVFARLGDEAAPADADLWALAAELVPGPRPGDFNQALMELGATVCTPRSPRCGACPLRERCAAFRAGTQARRPLPRKRAAIPHERTSVAVVVRNGALLLARRPVDVRLGGMWEFPAAVRRDSEPPAAGAERALREGLQMTGEAGACLGAVEHVFTHVRVTYEAVRCSADGQPRPVLYDAFRWVAPAELTDYALPAAQKRIASLAIAALRG
jgi:A/G-specific adenine glycosylase